MAAIFSGKWEKGYWKTSADGPHMERVEIERDGSYFRDGKHVFNVRRIRIDEEHNVVQFSLLRVSGKFHEEEYLAAGESGPLTNRGKFVGVCSHGHRMEYRRPGA